MGCFRLYDKKNLEHTHPCHPYGWYKWVPHNMLISAPETLVNDMKKEII